MAVMATLDRTLAEAVFAAAVHACDPAARVRAALADPSLAAWRVAPRIGIALGKAALAMARGAGPVRRGIVVAHTPGEVPPGWELIAAAHPEPDERSVAAGRAVLALVAAARPPERIVALISGGASALAEVPRGSLAELRDTIGALAAAGAPIAELNAVRSALSAIKAGELAARSVVPIATLALSDVIGDDLAVIGSGPTIVPAGPGDLGAVRAARRDRARAILATYGVPVPAILDPGRGAEPVGSDADPVAADASTGRGHRGDHAEVIAPMSAFAAAAHAALAERGVASRLIPQPMAGDVAVVAQQLVAAAGMIVAWGEPTSSLPPDHGEGGRAQQLALELARRLAGTDRAALVIGSDGADGPRPRGRPTPAGAFVDGTTWPAIRAAGLDPDAALARRDAGAVLAAVGALVVTGPTGINHADLVLLGDTRAMVRNLRDGIERR